MSKVVAVTGCCGFIGRVVTRQLLERGDYVYGVDALTYAADPKTVETFRVRFWDHFDFVCADVRRLGRWPDVNAIIHLAAETHVDNSLVQAEEFVSVNVDGTAHLLEMTRAKAQHGMPKFVYVSTDEVYGSIASGSVREDAPFNPSSPYAASKAAADLLAQAWGRTYNVPVSIVRPTNVYGFGQYPEKLIPKCVRSLILKQPIPIHGDGTQTRCWLNVEDAASAILHVLDMEESGAWNVGGNTEASVKDVATRIVEVCGGGAVEKGFTRPAGDLRYALDDSKLRASGWTPKGDFWTDLPPLIEQERGRFRF